MAVRCFPEVDHCEVRQRFESMTGLNQNTTSGSPADRSARVFPMSFAQQQVWFLNQLDPGTPVYNIARTITLDGLLDIGALQATLAEIVRRHEVLRTGYEIFDDQPVQVIHDPRAFDLPIVDLTSVPTEQQESEVRRLSQEEARESLDLQNGAIFRARLFRLKAHKHVLLVSTHHVASDGWSLRLLIEELGVLYQVFSTGKASPLGELPTQYRNFSAWQREYLKGPALENLLSFWKKQLAGAPPVLELPTRKARTGAETFQGAIETRALPKLLAEELRLLSRREGVTLFMTLVAAFQAVLARYSGQEDIVIGAPVSYRRRPEFEKLIGFFANTLVLRTDLSGNPTFRQLLMRVREVALSAHAHQDLPFQMLVEALRPERNLSRNPLFQVMLALQPSSFAPIELPAALTLSPDAHPIDTGTAKFDLSLSISESDRELSCLLEYNTDLFEHVTISRLLDHFERFLEQAVDDPERRLSEVRLLTESERQQVLVDWNQTTQPSAESTVHALVEAQERRTPDAIAALCGREKISYSELNARANQLAHYLVHRGIGPETLVAVAVERGVEMVIALLGVLKAGGAYVPVDPGFPKDRIAYMLQDSKVRLVLTQDRLVSDLPQTGVENVRLDADWGVIAQEGRENVADRVSPETLAYLIYTSGSTGKPKGVQVEHGAVVNLLTSMQREPGLVASDVLLAVTTLSFDIAGLELFLPLVTGATIAVATRGGSG